MEGKTTLMIQEDDNDNAVSNGSHVWRMSLVNPGFPRGAASLLLGIIFAKNCIKIGMRDETRVPKYRIGDTFREG